MLDAARDVVLTAGIGRTSLAEIARRAGVSRMTIYRNFPDLDAILGALFTREFAGAVSQIEEDVSALPTARERLIDATIRATDRLATEPLLARIVALDPEWLLPYLTTRFGQSQRSVRDVYARYLAAGLDDGSIRPLRISAATFVLFILAQGMVLSATIAAEEGVSEEAQRELRDLLERYLRPGQDD